MTKVQAGDDEGMGGDDKRIAGDNKRMGGDEEFQDLTSSPMM